jgi:hypothetical protein
MSTGSTIPFPAASRFPLIGPAFVVLLHLVAIGLFPGSLPLSLLVVLEGASLVICAISLVDSGSALRTSAVLWLVALGLFGVVVAVRGSEDAIAPAAVALVVVGTLVGYGLHRYERVALGLVSEEP